MSRVVWWNGKFIPESEARVSIYDSALMFGDCAFEMCRTFNKKQFKLREHLERLYASCKYLRIEIPYSIEELERYCLETQAANEPCFAPDDEHRLMINVTRGLLSIYKDTGPEGVNVIIADFPLRWTVQGMGRLFDTGINAVIPPQRVPTGIEAKVKCRSRIHFLMANIEVSQCKGENNWALLLDKDGYIAEGTGSNFFAVLGDEIVTPIGDNVLRGISRAHIFELGRGIINFRVRQDNITPYDVIDASEAFFTGTPFCILPCTSLNGQQIGDGKPGRITQYFLNRWGEMLGVDIEQQIKGWDNGTTGISPYRF